MTCSFCRRQAPHMIAGLAAKICQNCTAKAAGEFAHAWRCRTDLGRRPDPAVGVGEFIADHPAPLMAG